MTARVMPWLLLLATAACSVGIPRLNLSDLVNASDVIAIAEVNSVTKTPSPAKLIEVRSQTVQAQEYLADISIRKNIKGVAPPHIEVRYLLPTVFAGYRQLHLGTRIILEEG